MIGFAKEHPIITLLIAWAAFATVRVIARGYEPPPGAN